MLWENAYRIASVWWNVQEKNPKFILCKNNKQMQEWDKVNIKVDKQKIEQIQNGQIQPFLVIQRCDKDTDPK